MDEKEETPLFDETPAGPRKAYTSTGESRLDALHDAYTGEARRKRKERIKANAPKLKPPEPFTSTFLGGITRDLEPKFPEFTIFPNAYQLGLDSERAVYSTLLAYFWQRQGKLTANLSRENAREMALGHFLGVHKTKAFAVADMVYRTKDKFSELQTNPQNVMELFFGKAHQGHEAIQIGLQGFETVIFNPGNTLADLKHWAQFIKLTADDARSIFFEMTVESRLGRRSIRHPFDIVFEDLIGQTHIIELTNRRRESYDYNKARLVEDALLELVADRVLVGEANQQINLSKPQHQIGAGEVWAIKDRPEPDKILQGVHLSDGEMQEALEIMRSTKLKGD